jgi:hypothetical protein
MTMVYAVEGWILALIGWGWLAAQEMWAWSLLSALVFYGLIWLSTCNVIALGVWPASAGLRSAYFSAVLVLFLFALCAVLDTLNSPQMGALAPFQSPFNASCTLARTQQLFFFSETPFYLAQAGATLGYLVIQLVLAGAAMLDTDKRSIWPGTAWPLGLAYLLSARFVSTFDGTSKGVLAGQSKFVQLFSLPVVEFTVLFAGFMYFMGALLGIEGLLFPGVNWRKSARYVSFAACVVFFGFSFYALAVKGLLTPWLVLALCLIVGVSVLGLIEAVRAPLSTPPPPPPPSVPVFQPYAQPAQPSVPYGFQAGVPLPFQPPGPPYPYPPGAMGKQARGRLVIPSPVEMLGEKNKGV